ncbi:glycosyl transferase [Desulfuromonas versatilis]|uniref:Glycosyl transferase n=1 Tax=Desulfuromonas versatilis TaxID=2802975 RepID=A0ABN6DZS5_9BACT|nr:glycosyltransferase family 2 protein [Desulfuromonas versatilis]BCR05034.1 glycosyl transferase [Desulfuromonas versatilis]
MQKISFVIPVYNEEDNLESLYREVSDIARKLGWPYEFCFVDDCSSDGSLAVLRRLAEADQRVRFLGFESNCGQSAALYAGFQHTTGDVVITMDADLQNDPADIPAMLNHYGDYEMVTGWRHSRQDTLSKKLASRVGNSFRNLMTSETIHDTGCSLKVMNGDMVRRIKMFRGLHRFLPTLMRLEGARVLEVKVNHRARMHGVSKYNNLQRGIEGFFDVLAVRWMIRKHLKFKIRQSHV